MSLLSPRQRRTLALLCDTLLPAVADDTLDERLAKFQAPWLPSALEALIARVADPDRIPQLRLFLDLIELPGANAPVGHLAPFSRLDRAGREAVLRSWATSRLPLRRMAFQGIKRLALFLAYATMPDGAPHPVWPALHYPGPPPLPPHWPGALAPLWIGRRATLDCDVLVIGSGAGGGVMASELTNAGLDVIVAEKGPSRPYDGRERDSCESLLERAGALTTADTAIVVLAGSALGGGTVVNWTTALPPPDELLEEWATRAGFTGATSAAYRASLAAVTAALHVTTEESLANPQNQALERGCRALGLSVRVIPRNVARCVDCSFCTFGCGYRAKQDAVTAFLEPAARRGARIVPEMFAHRLTIEAGRATGAVLRTNDHDVIVRARAVVVAAGAIGTPALLLRSGLTNEQIGRNLHLQPTTVGVGLYPESIAPWRGVPQSRLCDAFADLDGAGYGVRLETAPAHPGLTAATLPWEGGAQHKALLARYDQLAAIIVIARDRHGGRVRLRPDGQPLLDYRLHPDDAAHLMRGLLAALRIHHAAGADTLIAPFTPLTWHRGGEIEDFLAAVGRRELRPNSAALFSAHQLSSCRIGASPAQGALTPEGESWEVRNLFVADGSVLPTATGVNPMVTIAATAHYLAGFVAARLT
ncbi:MAG: GMC oxidoreductase [Dehalococcoidia bacterium]|nr:MAG: GMC oxidoreductase [Dehalococcoidia bacterium]